MMLSVVDAQDLYMSAKAFTALEFSELEAAWHKPALDKLAKVMAALAQGAQPGMPMPGGQPVEGLGGGYGANQQNIV